MFWKVSIKQKSLFSQFTKSILFKNGSLSENENSFLEALCLGKSVLQDNLKRHQNGDEANSFTSIIYTLFRPSHKNKNFNFFIILIYDH